jgi:formyltetrahydrofolate-dependent phosphoribosylglycinamide formyltransferase
LNDLNHAAKSPVNLAVLVSGSGTTLQNLIDQINAGALDAKINIVIGSRPELLGLQRASDAKLMNFVVDRRSFEDVASFSKAVFSLCDDAGVDLVVLAGWLCLLDLPEKYAGRVMNIHPALSPQSVRREGDCTARRCTRPSINYGCKVSGCTVHFVDAQYDNGPIIVQRVCEVRDDDTPATLAARVFAEEKIAYPQAIRLFGEGRLRIEGRRVRVGNPVANRHRNRNEPKQNSPRAGGNRRARGSVHGFCFSVAPSRLR